MDYAKANKAATDAAYARQQTNFGANNPLGVGYAEAESQLACEVPETFLNTLLARLEKINVSLLEAQDAQRQLSMRLFGPEPEPGQSGNASKPDGQVADAFALLDAVTQNALVVRTNANRANNRI